MAKTIKEILTIHFIDQGFDEIEAKEQVDNLAVEYSEYAPYGNKVAGRKKRRNYDREFDKIVNHNSHKTGELTAVYNVIRNLYFGFRIPFDIFKIDGKHIIPPKFEKLQDIPRFYPINFALDTKKAINGFKQLYRDLFVSLCFSEITRSYKMYDYLGKGHHQIPEKYFENYLMVHEEIFTEIEAALRNNPKMKYSRILAVPFNEKVEREKDNFNINSKMAFDKCSAETFHHLCKCIKEFGLGSRKRIQIYITCSPPRNYQFGICDNDFLFSEHYRTTEKGKTIPEYIRLYPLYKMDKETEDVLHIHETDFNRIIDKPSKRFKDQSHFIRNFTEYVDSYRLQNDDFAERKLAFLNKKIICFNSVFSQKLKLKKLLP